MSMSASPRHIVSAVSICMLQSLSRPSRQFSKVPGNTVGSMSSQSDADVASPPSMQSPSPFESTPMRQNPSASRSTTSSQSGSSTVLSPSQSSSMAFVQSSGAPELTVARPSLQSSDPSCSPASRQLPFMSPSLPRQQ